MLMFAIESLKNMSSRWQLRFQRRVTSPLAVIGGRFEFDNYAIFEEMKRYSGGRMAVFATASEEPEEVGQEMVEDLRHYGFEAQLVPLFWSNHGTSAFEPALVRTVEELGSVYFTGGDQAKIVASLRPDGVETPLLKAIRQVHAGGGLVAGSSAGAAMMSERIILSGTSVEALVDGRGDDPEQPGLVLGQGLGFFRWGMVDQHFIKRGRIGRLLVAMREAGCTYGFGIDENTGMFVDNGVMRIIGESGAVIADLSQAEIDAIGGGFKGVRLSYLDDGDSYDLARHKAIPNPKKKRIRVTKSSYATPAPFRRNAFGSYALHELMIRLMQGNPSHYLRDRIMTYEPRHETEVLVELERVPRRSRALSAKVGDVTRYTAVNFLLNIETKRLPEAAWRDLQNEQARRFFDERTVAPEAHLIVLGSSPLFWEYSAINTLRQYIAEPVGIIATASSEPYDVARDYIEWLYRQDIDAEDIDVTAWNVDSRSRDRHLLERIASKRTLLFTGGDQRRLVETLLNRGEATGVLRAIMHAYQRGATLIAVGAAASAVSSSMIAEGNSYDALRYGASSDAGYEGMIIEEGFGLFEMGILDQNLMERRRLGRLIVACAEKNNRFGFGLCEESGMIMGGANKRIQAFGRYGFLVVTLDSDKLAVNNDCFSAHGIELSFVQPGEVFDMETARVLNIQSPSTASSTLQQLVADLARECGATLRFGDMSDQDNYINIALTQGNEGKASLTIQSRRARA
jgi:cyanophycinase